jgi:hypothetical protein
MSKLYTAAELKAFDRLTARLSSLRQLDRIDARLKIDGFVKEHGKEKCDAMFAEIQKLVAKRRRKS